MSAYISLALIVFLINCAPAFVPPTWTVLVSFVLIYHLPIPFVILIGVACATLGRLVLYLLAFFFGNAFLTKKTKGNFHALGTYFNMKKHISILLFLTYAFIPLPSNQLFITAGLAKVNIIMLAIAFAFGRLISYSWTIYSSQLILEHIPFHVNKTQVITFQILGIGVIFIISQINWKKVLHLK